MRSRVALSALLCIALLSAGCVGGPLGSASPTSTPPSGEPAVLPDGPKEQPDRPEDLTRSSVRAYVHDFEYRYAYNSLWINKYTEVVLECRVDDLTERAWGYEAVVTCTGYSNTKVPDNATATPGPHADWFTQSYQYLVTAEATYRKDAETRDPVN